MIGTGAARYCTDFSLFSIAPPFSSVTDVLGFVPLIPSPFWRPLAVSFIGGLLLATAIGLLVVPALYCWYYKVEGPKAS